MLNSKYSVANCKRISLIYKDFNQMTKILHIKCIVAGDTAVGKTALIQALESQVALHVSMKSYKMCLGLKLSTVTVKVPEAHNEVEFYFYDSSGRDIFKEVLLKYWANTHCVILVFDVTNESTLSSCLKWSEIFKSMENGETAPLKGLLIGNKVDKAETRVVSSEDGRQMAERLGLKYFECSAKNNLGIKEAFGALAKVMNEK